MPHAPHILVIGAGIGGLASAIDLAAAGFQVTVLERALTAGGKVRQVHAGGIALDAGPSVFTLPHVFERLFADARDDFHRRVELVRASVLARHAWSAAEQLDLYADADESAAAIGSFAGAREARGFYRFMQDAKALYHTLQKSFIENSKPSLLGLARRIGWYRPLALSRIHPFSSLWQRTSRYFSDPRLRQLFSRYATYCGSSPYESPATLSLIAYVEQAGVWHVRGGLYRVAEEMEALAFRCGVRFLYGTEVARILTRGGEVRGAECRTGETFTCDAIVCNADSQALADGSFGQEIRAAVGARAARTRSLSALTLNLQGRVQGFELSHHNVFFGRHYRAEFEHIFDQRQFPRNPTVYLCAQDRIEGSASADGGAERLFLLMNAPAVSPTETPIESVLKACQGDMLLSLTRCGASLVAQSPTVMTSPWDFARLFPATGGSLYGSATHGWKSSFLRPGSRTAIKGLYLAGGSAHPGAGIPMAAISGRLAATCIQSDFVSTARSR